jgi:lipopolysaccharide biosynthesis glycosyltransferase
MNRACACFTTDLGYMFPSLLSAIQARQNLDARTTDVVIILFRAAETNDDLFIEICRQKQIILITSDLDVLQSHTAVYARLFLDALLPEAYSRILYIDGDVQINAGLNELIQTELPGDSFSAVADPMCIVADQAGSEGRQITAYFDRLGVRNSPSTPYFNSGVLLVNRSSWAKISQDAINFLNEKPENCLFQDQSALNFAGHKKLIPMSFRWNFPIFFRNCAVEARIYPAIYHFMSKPKPWNGIFPPWNRSFYEPYVQLSREFPALAAYSPPMSLKTHIKYSLQQRVKKLQETISWRLSDRRQAILSYHEAGKF